MNFREGDTVSVEATLAYVHPDDEHLRIHIHNHHGPTYVTPNSVKLVKPNIQIGDQVKLRSPSVNQPVGPAVVLSIANDHLWVEWDDGEYATWWVGAVDRVALAGQKPEGGDA
jgi:hypothetical protein